MAMHARSSVERLILVLALCACATAAGAPRTAAAISQCYAAELQPEVHAQLVAAQAGEQAWAATPKPTMVGAYISEGIWSSNIAEAERQLKALGAAGVNMVIDYQLAPPTDTTKMGPGTNWRRYMDAAAAAKVKVAFSLPSYMSGLKPSDGTSNAKFDKVRDVVRLLRNESSIGYWYVHDEKLPHTTIGTSIDMTKNYCPSIEQMIAIYNLIKTEDSTANGGLARKQMQVWVSLPAYTPYKNRFKDANRPFGNPDWLASEAAYNTMMTKLVQQTTDIVMIDNYPHDNPGVPAADRPTALDNYPRIALTRAKSLLKAGQPMVFVFQSFNWKLHNPAGAPNASYPSLAQMKTMLGPARDLGCHGVIAYNTYDLDNPAEAKRLPGYDQCFKDVLALFNTMKTAWP